MAKLSIRPSSFTPPTPAELTQVAIPAPDRQWSPYQQAIFQFVKLGRGSAVVIAVAGSGKTSTIVEAAKFLPTDSRFSAAFVAFNKSIADELKVRLPASVRAQTLNSLGFGAWRRHIGEDAAHLRLDANKTRSLVQDVIPPQHYGLFSKGMPRLVGIAKAIGLVPSELDSDEFSGLVDDTDDTWLDMVETLGIDMGDANLDDPGQVERMADYARRILVRSIQLGHSLIDFDDQLYLPVITGARFWQNDIIMADEAQDLNRIQRVILRRALKPNGRLIAVGDERQSLYSFRGADSSSMANIRREFDCVDLPLTISYRCPKLVVREAHQWVSHIQPAATAIDGVVRTLSQYDATLFQPADVVLCRNTKPLVELAFNLLRDGVTAKVRGRDLGAGLVALIRRFKAATVSGLEDKLQHYTQAKITRFLEQRKDDLAQRLQDQTDTLHIFMEDLPPDAPVEELVRKIESLFTDNGPQVLTLSTVHRFKGSEAERVFFLDRELCPSRFARTPEARLQEDNIAYVAVTRAKRELVYISTSGFKSGKGQKQAGKG